MKCCVHEAKLHLHNVAPVRERGLKCFDTDEFAETIYVAPVRERGLKCIEGDEENAVLGRSRKGAWIEIAKSWKPA